jgi:hypothetical protein
MIMGHVFNLTPKSPLHNGEGTSMPPINMIFSPSPDWRRGSGDEVKNNFLEKASQ